MPSIGTNSKPAYVYDAGTDTWIPIGPGEHTHEYIGKNVITTTGDIIYASAANTPARRGIGSTGQVLTVSGGLPTWATPASGKVLQVVQGTYGSATGFNTSTFTDTGLAATITPSATSSKVLVLVSHVGCYVANDGSANTWGELVLNVAGSDLITISNRVSQTVSTAVGITTVVSWAYLHSPSITSATVYKTRTKRGNGTSSWTLFSDNVTATILLLEIGA